MPLLFVGVFLLLLLAQSELAASYCAYVTPDYQNPHRLHCTTPDGSPDNKFVDLTTQCCCVATPFYGRQWIATYDRLVYVVDQNWQRDPTSNRDCKYRRPIVRQPCEDHNQYPPFGDLSAWCCAGTTGAISDWQYDDRCPSSDCFSEDGQILMGNGSLLAAASIEVGDEVTCILTDGKLSRCPVSFVEHRNSSQLVELTVDNTLSLSMTRKHFLDNPIIKAPVAAEDMIVGTPVYTLSQFNQTQAAATNWTVGFVSNLTLTHGMMLPVVHLIISPANAVFIVNGIGVSSFSKQPGLMTRDDVDIAAQLLASLSVGMYLCESLRSDVYGLPSEERMEVSRKIIQIASNCTAPQNCDEQIAKLQLPETVDKNYTFSDSALLSISADVDGTANQQSCFQPGVSQNIRHILACSVAAASAGNSDSSSRSSVNVLVVAVAVVSAVVLVVVIGLVVGVVLIRRRRALQGSSVLVLEALADEGPAASAATGVTCTSESAL